MKKILIFDLDDTLIYTGDHYIKTEEYFTNLFSEYNISKKEIKDLIKKEDLKLLKEHKYGYHWYEIGLLEVLNILSEKYKFNKTQFISKIQSKIKEEFKTPRKLYDGTIEILEYFTLKKYDLYIMTLGDKKIQTEKINSTSPGIKQFFKNIFIVSKKNKKSFSECLKTINVINNENVYFIGNSIEHDMIPALESGLNAVLINRHTFYYDLKINIPKNIKIIDDLIELKSIIK